MPLNHLLTNIPSDVYELRVALPEGAVIQKYETGSLVPASVATTKTWSFLDFIGRPTLVLRFEDFVAAASVGEKITVVYTFQTYLLIIEPLYLMIGLFLCFLVYIVTSRLDLSFGSLDLPANKDK